MKTLILVACLALTSCKVQRDGYVCDKDRREQAFLLCLSRAQNPSNITAAGNDADEVIESCSDSAREIWCHWGCVENCE